MTREDIIGLIAEASAHDPGFAVWVLSTPHIERIVNRAVKKAEADMQDACADYAAALAEAGWSAGSIADAIRARGSK